MLSANALKYPPKKKPWGTTVLLTPKRWVENRLRLKAELRLCNPASRSYFGNFFMRRAPVTPKPTDVSSSRLPDVCEFVRSCTPPLCTAARIPLSRPAENKNPHGYCRFFHRRQ